MLILGVDGGGTGCRAAVADMNGAILGRGTAGPANIHTAPDSACAAIIEAAGKAAAMAGQRPEDLVAVLGLAGANMPDAVAVLRPRLPFHKNLVISDAVTSTRGALGGGDGIVAALGTGSIFATQRGGRVTTHGGHGFILGDEGGGARLGRAALAEALRIHDGIAPPSPFLEALLQRMGGPEGVISFADTASPTEFAKIARPLVEAVSDDPGAERVLAAATAEVTEIIDFLRHRTEQALDVVFIGGLGPTYASRLEGCFPIRTPLGTALDGALAIAHAWAETGAEEGTWPISP